MIRYFIVPYDSGHRGAGVGAGPQRLAECVAAGDFPVVFSGT
jgi:hypothetical protein